MEIWNILHQRSTNQALPVKFSNFSPIMAWLGRIFGFGLVTGCEINSNEPPVMRDQPMTNGSFSYSNGAFVTRDVRFERNSTVHWT